MKLVDEIDMNTVDPNPNRGVWVMGLEEPVKLLNEHPYDEFEVVIRNKYDLVEEIIKKCSAEQTTPNFMAVFGILSDDDFDEIVKSHLICDCLKVERRGNRQSIYKRLISLKTC